MSEEQRRTSQDSERVRRLINAGTEILGSSTAGVAGTAVGLFASGFTGAALGGAAGTALLMGWRALGSEMSKRLLGPREEARVGFVFSHSAVEIQERLRQGETLRDDGFFDSQEARRSSADEVAESVLLKSQREPEEKKLPYMAHLLASIAFDSTISVHLSHQLIRSAEQLTYRQLCILKLAVVKEQFALRSTDYRGGSSFSRPLFQLFYECMGLYHNGFINFGGQAALGFTGVVPGKMSLQGLGADIYNLMRLHRIPNSDIAPIATVLS